MIHEHIEETDGYAGLHGEVVTEDVYRLKQLDFTPDLIFDLGANIGVFTIYAKSLFPGARIVAVEPDPQNVEHFKRFVKENGVTLLESAVGTCAMRKKPSPENGAHASYREFPYAPGNYEPSDVGTISIEKLMGAYMLGGMRAALKLDIEGNESAIFNSVEELEAIARVDYFAMEVHREVYGERIGAIGNFIARWFSNRFTVEVFDAWNLMIYGRKRT